MSEIVDILFPKLADCPSFTVNTAVDYVAVTQAAGVDMYSGGQAAASAKFIAKGDSLTLLSFGYYIPESFALATMEAAGPNYPGPCMIVGGVYPSGVSFNLPLFGGQSLCLVPLPNFEFTNTAFFSASGTTDKFKIRLTFHCTSTQEWRISMLNVPTAFNGKVFKILPFLKVLHNFIMTT